MAYLEDEIRDALASLGGAGKCPDIIMARFGWDGGPRRTLQEVGDQYGLTRERVRQICARAERNLADGTRVRRGRPPRVMRPNREQKRGLRTAARKQFDTTFNLLSNEDRHLVAESLGMGHLKTDKGRATGGTRPGMPTLREALTLVQEHAPCTSERVTVLLEETGLSSGKIGGAGLLSAAEFFSCDCDVEFVPTGSGGFVVHKTLAQNVGRARQVARRLVGAHGAATVAEVTAGLFGQMADSEQERHEEVVRLELDSDSDIVWLDSERRWLWMRSIPDGRNRLLNNIRRVLSVAGRIDAAELRRAVRRDWRMGGYAPPASVLLALADAVPGLTRDGALVRAAEPCLRADCLSNTEDVIAEVLLENGGAVRLDEIRQAVMAYGVGEASFKQCMSQSPIVRKYAPGIYGLSGIGVPASSVEALVKPVKRSKVLQDCGWTDDGRVWVAYRLNRNTLEAAVLAVPATVREFITGEHTLRDQSNEDVGVLVAKDYSAWGVRRFLRMAGAEEGDTLLLVFDPANGTCHAYVGDDTVRDDVLGD